MKPLLSTLLILLLACGFSAAQTYQKEDATLNIFTINDTLKYFEFYTPEFLHTNVEVGILSKSSINTYDLKYTDGPFFSTFELLFKDSNLRVLNIENEGWIALDLKGSFFLRGNQPQQISHFNLNHSIFYSAKKKDLIKAYEFPCLKQNPSKFLLIREAKLKKNGVLVYTINISPSKTRLG
ncbi:hypothetical protein SAMN05192529_11619 [Arachidicoccus rhizosphaerae]|uniref:Uncharacterized protein n=1 Tax=Arachidicoccus rhizosphaerae TaxID=551991 RepID=A0A1H4AR68_9BACT|nr:hypothetical protein [Arachidicoccus rhizosphaerae]SEA38214.1 hypothetical protein SAMN05192529_11619 [Arachidicoccus rhizosphaerae]